MRRFLAFTFVSGLILSFLAASVLQTLRLDGRGLGGVSGADLLDQGSIGRLRLQLTTVGGTVLRLTPHMLLRDHGGAVFQVDFASGVTYLLLTQDRLGVEHRTRVSKAAIERGAHLRLSALRSGNGYIAYYNVLITPHYHALGGLLVSNQGVLTIVDHHGMSYLVQLAPDAAVTLNKLPYDGPVSTRQHVVALAYPDPQVSGLYLAGRLNIIRTSSSKRVGGIVKSIDPVRNLIVIYTKTENRDYTIEVTKLTKITLSSFAAGYADMRIGDHLTVTGKIDTANPGIGPNPLLAKIIRISSPNWGGSIATITPATAGAVVLMVHGRHGHMLRIDAPGKTEVYTQSIDGRQTGNVLDLFVGDHISAKGTRVGKFEITAQSIHVYPHTRLVGGAVVSVLPGRYRLLASNGTQYIIHTTIHTVYLESSKPTIPAAVKVGIHIRVRGYDALHSDQKRIETLVATRVIVIVHHPAVHHTAKKKTTPKSPTPTPTPKTGTPGQVLRVPLPRSSGLHAV